MDPRFPGGTSTAAAAELPIVASLARLRVHAVEAAMFGGRELSPALAETFDELGIAPDWDSPVAGADLVVFHNPVFLKFQDDFAKRIVARHLVVVTYENFLRPGGAEAFDVARCLDQIDRAALTLRKSLAPVSALNRATVCDWLQQHPGHGGWQVLDRDWFSICDFPRIAPTSFPSDRRGRLSRPGFEKFPPLSDMDLCFPDHGAANIILGADALLASDLQRPHWTMIPFNGLPVQRFFDMIDFLVHFTAPTWRESFGRALAGKVVISDPETASTFAGAVVPATPAEVDETIAHFVANPALYRSQVLNAQSQLDAFSGRAFRAMLQGILGESVGAAA
jgi:hypothetical protein